MNIKMYASKGFTLIEMLLVMVIVSIIIYASVGYIQQRAEQARIDKTTLQMQQILNAGLAYYVDNSFWPKGPDLTWLQGSYLPPSSVPFVNGWGQPYRISHYPTVSTNPKLFYVITSVKSSSATSGSAAALAQTIAGLLPMAYISNQPTGAGGGAGGAATEVPPPPPSSCAGVATCYIVASVNIPGQNLNNARAVNFAGLYHHGACVPVPVCPVASDGTQTQPQIIVVPVSVGGFTDANNNTNVYPISSFTAYAVGPSASGVDPGACNGGTAVSCAPFTTGPSRDADQYWRVCLQLFSEVGEVTALRTDPNDKWGQDVTLAAFTRCATNQEPSGSSFQVFSH